MRKVLIVGVAAVVWFVGVLVLSAVVPNVGTRYAATFMWGFVVGLTATTLVVGEF